MKKIAIVGVNNTLGREILSLLEENGTSADSIFAVDVNSPLGTQVSYGEDIDLDVFNLDDFDFSSVSVAVFATTSEIAKRYIPKATAQKVLAIDCTSSFADNPDVPVIISGINDNKIFEAKKNIISIPSPQVTQLLIPLQKVLEEKEIKRIVISTYMSTSIYGREAMDELFTQTKKIFMNEPLVDDENVFHKQIAFNVLPQVGEFIGDETKYEWAMNVEIKKIIGSDIKVHANCAFVPAFIGIGEYVNIECEDDVDVDDVRNLMRDTKGVVVFDKHVDCGYVSLNDVQGENDIYISRLRQDISVENGFSFWCVADDLRAGTSNNIYNILKTIQKK
jgi:aspartate-semialdehyde dehydrogenase